MKTKKTIIRYSEAFKCQVLNEIEAGTLTFSSAKAKYKIAGGQTIMNWARKYGRFGMIPILIRVEKPNERSEIKALKDENKRLKEAIADMVLHQRIAESTLEVICEQQGWNVEEIKKKAGQLLPKRPLPKAKM